MLEPGSLLAAVLLTTASGPALAQTPPPEVLQKVALAGAFNESFVGSYRTVVNAVISKPDGGDREDSHTDSLRVRDADGTRVEMVLRASKNGEDTTLAARAKQEGREDAKAEGKSVRKSGKSFSVRLGLPETGTADHFVYTALPSQGRVCRTRFAPSEEHRNDDGISQGELAWWCDTLEPLWAVASPFSAPTGVSELNLRMEFARTADTRYVARLTTTGVGGILFYKRKIHMTMEVTDVSPATPVSAAASPK